MVKKYPLLSPLLVLTLLNPLMAALICLKTWNASLSFSFTVMVLAQTDFLLLVLVQTARQVAVRDNGESDRSYKRLVFDQTCSSGRTECTRLVSTQKQIEFMLGKKITFFQALVD